MRHRVWLWVVLAAAIAGASACAASKSSNPLSPSVAGPIPGVSISAPRAMTPTPGTRIAVDGQPITLVVANASSNGVRPLVYSFEVATDTGFTNKVFSRDNIQPGDGQTSLKLPDPLASGRTYYWRAMAQDGANTGPFSSSANFDVFTPIVISAPELVSPTSGTTENTHPTFVWKDAPRTGPAGAITYVVEVADSSAFTNRIAVWTVAEQAGQTSLAAPQDLPYAKQFFWRVRATDPTTTGPFSSVASFQTPVQVIVAPPPAPTPVPTGPQAGDQMNLGLAAVYNSPPDIASWPVTASITRINMSSSDGLSFDFTTKQSWPDYTPPGWDGPLQYTVWAVVNIGGQWYTSGFIQMWRGRASTGGPILAEFSRNWAYDARWGPMMGYQPHAGEQMGFFVSAGNARNEGAVTSLRERSNVVLVNLPPGDSGSFSFSFKRIGLTLP